MTLRELHDAVENAMWSSGTDELPVIVKYDDGGSTVVYDASAATKQGDSFRIYVRPESRRVIEL